MVDAALHARVPATLEQRAAWLPGIVRATNAAGQFLALWEGRTTRRVPFTLGAEIRNPGSEFGGLAGASWGVSAPCAHVPVPGPGFSARVSPASAGPFDVGGRNAAPLTYAAGRYLVQVTLHGDTETRQYSLPFTVR